MRKLPFRQLGPLEHDSYTDHLVRLGSTVIREGCKQCLPRRFDPWAAARLTGIHVRIVRMPSTCEGAVHIQHDGILIDLRLGDPHERLRFTLAHELAHLLFVQNGVCRFVHGGLPIESSEAAKKEEIVCNRIAAELLMPRAAFSRKGRALFQRANCQPGLAEVAELSREFCVSYQAVQARVAELRLWRTGIRPINRDRPVGIRSYNFV
jgi:hypothetical protein